MLCVAFVDKVWHWNLQYKLHFGGQKNQSKLKVCIHIQNVLTRLYIRVYQEIWAKKTTTSNKYERTTWVLLQVWLDVVTFGCGSLSAAVSADGILLGFLFLSCTFISLLGSSSGQDEQWIPHLQQYLFVMCHPIQHPAHIQSSMTLPTRANAIFSTFARHTKPRHKTNLAKELKFCRHTATIQ